MKIPILSLSSEAYAQEIKNRLGKGYEHARLLYQEWMRQGTHLGLDPAFNNAKKLLQEMVETTDWSILDPVETHGDGSTQKILLRTSEGYEIESVVIPMEAGGTLCISSQVGCKMGCKFCETGKMGLLKNLKAEEIVSQVFYALHVIKASLRNIVFMGMGEPFDNYEEVMKAFRVINDTSGLNFGARHVTISTSGKVDEIKKLAGEEVAPHLAVSINAPTDALRTQLMPINKTYPLSSLKEAISYYNQKTGRMVLAAYVLMKGINDQEEHAEEFADFLKGLNVKVNLIPYNAQSENKFGDSKFETPENEQVGVFKQLLIKKGFQVLLRKTKGDQIMAACGQLGKRQLRKKRLPLAF